MSFGEGNMRERVSELEAQVDALTVEKAALERELWAVTQRCAKLEKLVQYMEPWIENAGARKLVLPGNGASAWQTEEDADADGEAGRGGGGMTDYEKMRADLSRMTMKELRRIARDEGICLGYAGSRKKEAVDEIVGQREYREREGMA